MWGVSIQAGAPSISCETRTRCRRDDQQQNIDIQLSAPRGPANVVNKTYHDGIGARAPAEYAESVGVSGAPHQYHARAMRRARDDQLENIKF